MNHLTRNKTKLCMFMISQNTRKQVESLRNGGFKLAELPGSRLK
ncbi:hypothetical protein RDI58_016540 [Solanum bulbocastanum]|uniref:Uncharacterized protein n=1 Tax=Solanum bulbocastanum TaxID=147425 RepID=A0AAN8THN9_SOLBU